MPEDRPHAYLVIRKQSLAESAPVCSCSRMPCRSFSFTMVARVSVRKGKACRRNGPTNQLRQGLRAVDSTYFVGHHRGDVEHSDRGARKGGQVQFQLRLFVIRGMIVIRDLSAQVVFEAVHEVRQVRRFPGLGRVKRDVSVGCHAIPWAHPVPRPGQADANYPRSPPPCAQNPPPVENPPPPNPPPLENPPPPNPPPPNPPGLEPWTGRKC